MTTYDITVKLTGTDGNAFAIIGTVREAIRKNVGNEAAQEFSERVLQCGSYDELLAFVQETVDVT